MDIDGFLKIVRKRRSICRFVPGLPIPDEHVRKILEAGRWAMSGGNGQPWEFIVVRDQQTRDRIADASMEHRFEQLAIELTRVSEIAHPQHGRPPEAESYRTAQLLIAVLGDRRAYQATALSPMFMPGPEETNGVYVMNIANACNNICLAVTALGYSCQWSTVNRMWEETIKETLDIPVMLDVFTLIPIGYPAYKPSLVYRRELDELVHYEKYDRKRYRTGNGVINWVKHLREMTVGAYRQAESDDDKPGTA